MLSGFRAVSCPPHEFVSKRSLRGSFIRETEVDDDLDIDGVDNLDDDELVDDLELDFIHRNAKPSSC